MTEMTWQSHCGRRDWHMYIVNLYIRKIPIDFSIYRDPYGAMGPWEFTNDFGAAPAKVAGCEKYNFVCRAWRLLLAWETIWIDRGNQKITFMHILVVIHLEIQA